MLIVEKQKGVTMGELIKPYREKNKVCFCGRLDPLAYGKVILLLDDECKKKSEYINKDKEYEFEIVIGIQTDTDDFMGIIEVINFDYNYKIIKKQILEYLDKFNNKSFQQQFHNYSSKTFNGKPLWYISKNNMEVKKQIHNVTIYDYQYIKNNKYIFNNWIDANLDAINNISGDFRQKEIKEAWINCTMENIILDTIKVKIKVSSGFYIRQLVRDISEYIKFPLVVDNINRTNIFL